MTPGLDGAGGRSPQRPSQSDKVTRGAAQLPMAEDTCRRRAQTRRPWTQREQLLLVKEKPSSGAPAGRAGTHAMAGAVS